MSHTLITDLPEMEALALSKEQENKQFVSYIQYQNAAVIDSLVFDLNERITPQISCTNCGNCCKSLMITINDDEADALSEHLEMSRLNFDEQYIEKGNSLMVMNAVPCHFLSDNKCVVYSHRFEGCKEFPALHLPAFNKRLFTTFMHYDRCPIIYNVVEQLKEATNFVPEL